MLRKNSYVRAMENNLLEDRTASEMDVKLDPQPETTTIQIIRTNIELSPPDDENPPVVLRQRIGNMDQVAGERRSIMEMFNAERDSMGENKEYKDLLVEAEKEDKEIILAIKRQSDIVTQEIEPVIEEDSNTNTNNSVTVPIMISEENSTSFQVVYTGRNSIRRSRNSKRISPETNGVRTRISQRVVHRNGNINVPLILNIPDKRNRFMKDIITTLIDLRWRWLIFLFAISHFAIWFLFALMFYLSAYANGDLSDNPGPIPCITEGRTFTGIFGFSVESQVSIGYGEKSPTEECPEVAFELIMEVISGNLLLGIMVGVMYAKGVRPAKKLRHVGFSKNAVVCLRDGKMCLVFRVWDFKENHVIGTTIKALIVKHVVAGPVVQKLTITPENPLILWPVTVQHKIDEQSPLYEVSAKDFVDRRMEIIVTLTGSSRRTGILTQSRTSYLSRDVLWGQRFQNVMSYDNSIKKFTIDQKLLNSVQPVDVPLCSVKLLDKLLKVEDTSPAPSLPSPGWSFRFNNETAQAIEPEE